MKLTEGLGDLYNAIMEFKKDDDATIKLDRIYSIICSLSLDEMNAPFSEVYNKYFLFHPSL
jgi:hypothetical protein